MSEGLDLAPFAVWKVECGEDHIPKLLCNESEVGGVGELLATDTRVPGRIKGRQDVYQELGADPYIINLVEKGYNLKFDETPPPSFTRNKKSVLQNQDFCSQGASQI